MVVLSASAIAKRAFRQSGFVPLILTSHAAKAAGGIYYLERCPENELHSFARRRFIEAFLRKRDYPWTVDRCGDQPDIYAVGPAASKTFELFLLQHAQQLRLQSQRNIPDFIEKQRARIRHFKTARLLRECSGESTLLMSKQFAF